MKNAVNIMGKIFLIVIFLIAVLTAHVKAQAVTDNLSVDAIAVYSRDAGGQGNIYYSFFGHSPKTPKPVNTSLNWTWWTLSGDNVPASSIPNPIAGDHQQPSIAFSREGFAVAVWENFRQAGTINCADVPDPVYRGDILFSVWNGTNWSDAAIAVAGANDTILKDAAIAIDSNGNGLILYTKQVITRNAGCPGDSIYSVEYGRFQGSTKSFFAEGTLDGPAVNAPILAASEAVFTSMVLAPGLFTRHQAVAAWWSNDTVYSKNCTDPFGNQFQVQIPTFWPKKAIWNGTSFEQVGFIPDKLIPPPDLTDNLSVLPGKKLGISSDQFDHANVVWGIKKQSGDPCPPNLPNVSNENLNARWNGTEWDKRAAIFDTLVGGPRGIDIAYLPGNDAISVYDDFDPNLIKWSVESANTIWINRGQLGSGNGFDPTIASLAHNQTVAIWVNAGQIMWSNITNDKIATGSWSPAQVLAAGGGQPDIAAHTGSPTLPHAEWTYSGYFDGDNDLHTFITGTPGTDRDETLQIGSTNLVNVILMSDPSRFATWSGPAPFPDSNVRYEYIKRNSAAELKKLADIDSGAQNTLEDFIAFSVETYPAKRFVLDFGDHGEGWKGQCLEGTPAGGFTETSRMLMTELKPALVNNSKRFNIVTFSECLMAQLEVAYQIKDYANFMVGSEELMPGNGPNYTKILTNFTGKPFKSDADFAKNFVGFFREDYPGGLTQTDRTETLSAIDLSQVVNLKNAVNDFANAALAENLTNQTIISALRTARENAEEFPHRVWQSAGYSREGYRDLKHYARLVNQNASLPLNVRNAAQNVTNAVNAAVIANWSDALHPNVTGLSIYLERSTPIFNGMRAAYAQVDFARDTNWSSFIGNQTGSSGIFFSFNPSNPSIRLHTIDSDGNKAGLSVLGSEQGSRCSSSCGVNSGNAACEKLEEQTFILHPLVQYVNWSITFNASYGNYTNETFNLTIQLIENDFATQQQNISGTIQPDETISGVFTPALDIISRYDSNSSGRIERSEAVRAVLDFFSGLITRQEAIVVVLAFFGG